MLVPYVAREMFLTKGVGIHKEQLASFEEALREAKIAMYNLVHVSSIFPPYCKLIPREKGIEKIKPGQVLAVVLARNQTDEHRRLVAASIGVAIPKDKSQYGYLSEHHSYGQTDEEAGNYAEELAANMLCTILGVDFHVDAQFEEKKREWQISGKIYKTTAITQSAVGKRGKWTTVVAAAVLIP